MNEVKVWEEELILPTYEIGEAEKKSYFFLKKRVLSGKFRKSLSVSCYRKDPGRKD